MMSLRSVPFLPTEITARLLASTLADTLTSSRGGVATPRVPYSAIVGPVDRAEIQRQAGYFRIVSLVEAYTDEMHELLLQRETGPAARLAVVRALDEHLISASTNWGNRQEAFRRVHGIKLSGFPTWRQLDASFQARNAIAHGLGRLTRRQRRNPNLIADLAGIDVVVSSGQLTISEDSLFKCAQLAREYVYWVDAEAHLRAI